MAVGKSIFHQKKEVKMHFSESSRIMATILIVGILFFMTEEASGQTGSSQEKSLYERLGGLQGISLVVSDFVDVFIKDPVIMSNPKVKERKTPDSAPYIKYQVTSMVCQATGGPCQYTGLDMREAHRGLNVSDREWDRMVEIFAATLKKYNVPERETQELFGLIAPTKPDIVVSGNR
jgi:hemoglobin